MQAGECIGCEVLTAVYLYTCKNCDRKLVNVLGFDHMNNRVLELKDNVEEYFLRYEIYRNIMHNFSVYEFMRDLRLNRTEAEIMVNAINNYKGRNNIYNFEDILSDYLYSEEDSDEDSER